MGFFLDSGEAEVEPLKLIGESFGLNSQKVKESGMEITYVNNVFLGVVPKFVGVAI